MVDREEVKGRKSANIYPRLTNVFLSFKHFDRQVPPLNVCSSFAETSELAM